MKYYRHLLIIVGIFILAFFALRYRDKKIDTKTSSAVLAPGIREKIVVNSDTHKLSIFTKGHEQSLFLPDRPSSIEVGENGKVTVTSRQYGTELRPFGGLGYSDKLRLYAGVDLSYWKRFDGGVFLSGGLNVPIRVGGVVSYTVFSNTRLALGLDNGQKVNLLVSVRF